jgi:small-conductance mechanosensitive channel
MANQKILTTEVKNNKNWNFAKGNMTLGFTINTDIKTDLKDFKELLLEALKVVDIEINKHK